MTMTSTSPWTARMLLTLRDGPCHTAEATLLATHLRRAMVYVPCRGFASIFYRACRQCEELNHFKHNFATLRDKGSCCARQSKLEFLTLGIYLCRYVKFKGPLGFAASRFGHIGKVIEHHSRIRSRESLKIAILLWCISINNAALVFPFPIVKVQPTWT